MPVFLVIQWWSHQHKHNSINSTYLVPVGIFLHFNFDFVFQALVLLLEVCLCEDNVAEARTDF